MKPYSRRILDRIKAIINYILSFAQHVVEIAFRIYFSKWRILDKTTDNKLDTVVEIVKRTALLRSIIIDVDGLHDFS
jgi:hypothetical protein